MSNKANINIPHETIAEFCKRNYIRKLSFFGSVLRSDFRSDSDVDVLVEFDPEHVPGFFGLAHLERELSEILGKKVDLRTPQELSKYFRDEVVSSALVAYGKR
ncbi:MAG: nucleotidyltransferase family protein [Bacteroidota bacterium]|nr:nucleotidyltransferase family protein [Bacteroidota bacterium]